MENSSKNLDFIKENERTDEFIENGIFPPPQFELYSLPILDELLLRMRRVNEKVKANKLNTILGAEIFELCKIIKIRGGKELEENHKADLNKFFTSIRQAACRENGELGLPCRLKVLELLELRAMGWRTNLSHAQFFSKRTKELEEEGPGGINIAPGNSSSSAPPPPSHPSPAQFDPMPKTASAATNCLPPPFPLQNSPIPFSPFAIPPPQPCLLNSPPEMSAGFFFIPSRSGAFIPANLPPNQGPIFAAPSPQFLPSPISLFANQTKVKIVPNLLEGIVGPGNESTIGKSKINPPQFREEMTIKNSDSGKVMGVRGRRVALIEEISTTVISFQKVDPKCRERQLTIIAEEIGAIELAKRLIGETIERNVSPERPNKGEEKKLEKELGDKGGQESIQIVKQEDGSLKILSQDNSILTAAQDALKEYLEKFIQKNENNEFLKEKSVAIEKRKNRNEEEEMGHVYERSKLLNIRQKCEENENLIKEAKSRLAHLDIFVGQEEEGEGKN